MGYANDTAVYLRDRTAGKPVVTILDDFSTASGLLTYWTKSMVIDADPRGSALPLDTFGLTLQYSRDSSRYLGVPVGN